MKERPIFSDFDGTLTLNAQITPAFFSVIDWCQTNNSTLVVVSGRSTSWGHFLLTHTPIRYAIMENGGVILQKENKTIKQFVQCSDEDIEKLEEIKKKLASSVPQIPFAYDNTGRVADRAVEFDESFRCQLPEVQKVIELFGGHCSISNVHLNFWVGNFNKYLGMLRFAELLGFDISPEQSPFFGDSLNDVDVFAHYPHTVGVSNIDSVLARLEHHPKVILKGEENKGPLGVLSYLKKMGEAS